MVYNPIPVKGTFKKPEPKPVNPVQIAIEAKQEVSKLANDLKSHKSEIKVIVDKKIKELDKHANSIKETGNEAIRRIGEVKKSIDSKLQDLKDGNPGKDAEPIDIEEIINEVINRLPDQQTFNIDEIVAKVKSEISVPAIDEKKIIYKILKSLPKKAGDLKIIQEKVEIDPMSVIEKIMELPADKFKLKLDQIDGLDQTLKAFRSQLGRGYLHGGGDTVKAGTNVTIVKNADGTKTINATGGVTTFLGLTDVPHSYSGQGGKAVYVNGTEDGLVFQTAVSSDEKVKLNASDPTAGYLDDKITGYGFVTGTPWTGLGYITRSGISAGTGISYNNSTGVITNSAPDQTVAITAGTNITSVTGTYPNFTINAATQTTDISGLVPYTGATTNLDLNGKVLKNFFISKTADTTAKFVFDVGALSTGTTRTLTVRDASGTLAYLTDIPATPDLTPYAKLDGTNQPFTGDLNISKATPTLTLTSTDDSNNTATLSRSVTSRALTLKNYVGQPTESPYAAYMATAANNYATASLSGTTLTAFTLEFWLYPTANGSATNFPFCWGTVGNVWWLLRRNADNTISPTFGNAYQASTTATLNLNVWNYIAATWDGATTWTLRINGTTKTYTGIANSNQAAASPFGINGLAGSFTSENAYYDEMRVYNYAKTSGQLDASYGSFTNPSYGTTPDSGLLAGWHFDEGTGSTATDYSGNSKTMTFYGSPLPTWVAGKVTAPATAILGTAITYQDGVNALERGILTIGDYSTSYGSRNVLEGLTTRFNVLGTQKGILSGTSMAWTLPNTITGSTDAIQLKVVNNATQTTKPIINYASNGSTENFSVDSSGNVATVGTVDGIDVSTIPTVYAKLDGTNQPFTGNLNVSKATPEIRLADTGSTYYSRYVLSATNNTGTLYNKTGTVPVLTKVTKSYTGSDQTWTVPAGVTSVTLKVWGGGGAGSSGGGNQRADGGEGGFTQSTYAVTPGDVLTIKVGRGGTYNQGQNSSVYVGGGATQRTGNQNGWYGGAGGGLSAVYTAGGTLIALAGGGGGGSSGVASAGVGGIGGGTTGGSASYPGGGGGTPSAGGAAGSGGNGNGTAGSSLQGGSGIADQYNGNGGGGGGGYYGGGGGGIGTQSAGGGGGGSSYVNGSCTATNLVQGKNSSDTDWSTGIAVAGSSSVGGDGKVVIAYISSFSYAEQAILSSYDGVNSGETATVKLGSYSTTTGTNDIYEGLTHNWNILGTNKMSLGSSGLSLASLTATRIPFAGTAGLLGDSSTLTYSATTGLATTKPVTITGSTDAIQLKVIGNATQTNKILSIQTSASAEVASIDNAGSGTFNHYLAVGGTNPGLRFWVGNQDDGSSVDMAADRASADTAPSGFLFRKARGTIASPTIITTGDQLGYFLGRGYAGVANGYTGGAGIRFLSEGTISTTAVPGVIQFLTTPASSITPTEVARFNSSGYLGIGNNNPAAPVDVLGNTNSALRLLVKNTNAGSSARTGMLFTGDTSSNYAGFDHLSSTFNGGAGTEALAANSSVLYSGSADTNGFSIIANATNSPIKFFSGGIATANEAMRITGSGNIGIGTTAPSTKLHVLATTEQLRLGYDASNYLSATIGSTGSATLDLTGTTPRFLYSKGITLPAGTATAGTAPLKFTSGTVLAATEAGAIEFNTDDYYATISTGAGGNYSLYPPVQNATYVKADSSYSASYYPYFATDPTKSLTGDAVGTSWITANVAAPNVFQIDLGSSKSINKIYYENLHVSGGLTNYGVRAFTLWGSNTCNFTLVDPASDTDWTQITAGLSQNEFDIHSSADVSDPKYITLTKTTAYRYYRFKFTSDWGAGTRRGFKRVELQDTTQPIARKNIVLTDNGALTLGRVPYATTNGRLKDDASLTYDATTGLLSTNKITATLFNSTATQTTTNGLTGTAVSSQPFQGTSYKKFIVYLTNFTSAGTVLTFPTAFVKAPVVYGDAAAIAIAVTTTTTTTLTSVGAVAGFIIIEGY